MLLDEKTDLNAKAFAEIYSSYIGRFSLFLNTFKTKKWCLAPLFDNCQNRVPGTDKFC